MNNRSRPICNVPEIGIGNKPIDDGNYLFTDEEKAEFVKEEPASEKWFRRWYGSREFINRCPRWCLWLGDCAPNELKAMPEAMKLVEAVKQFRLDSVSAPTRAIAATPTRFHVENFPSTNYLLIPEVSSERRAYIPMGFMSPDDLSSNLVKIVDDATPFHFGVLSSSMHMAWVRTVCGRLKSDYRYSAKGVYNNYPWPQNVSDKKREAVESAAQAVLDVREQFPDSSLADLYDPLSMPAMLTKAHAKLDRAVDRCYRSQPFPHERNRVEFLFELYEQLAAPLVSKKKAKKRK